LLPIDTVAPLALEPEPAGQADAAALALGELPPEARKELDFVLADSIEDVFAVAFASPGRSRPKAAPAAERQAAASV